jgi:YVTN family beta-propeller protein
MSRKNAFISQLLLSRRNVSSVLRLVLFGILIAAFALVSAQAAEPERVYLGTISILGGNGFPAEVVVYDPATRAVLSEWDSIQGFSFESIHRLAVSPDGTMVYVPVNGPFDNLVRFYQANGTESAPSCNVGSWPMGVAVKPDGSEIYVASYSANTVSVIGTAAHNLLATINVGTGPSDVAISPDGAFAFVSIDAGDAVQVISTSSRAVVATIPVGDAPFGLALNPSGTKLFVAVEGTDRVAVIDTATRAVIQSIDVGDAPHWVAVAPDGGTVWVTSAGAGTVSVIDTASYAVTHTVTVGTAPEGIAIRPDGHEVWVVNSSPAGGTSVSVIDTSAYSVANVAIPSGPFGDLVGYSLAITDTTSRFAGRVSSGGAPVSGAVVSARQGGVLKGEATTNASGDYSIFNLDAGTYDIEVTASGFPALPPSSETVAVGQTHIVNFALTSNTCVSSISPASAHFFPNGGSGSIQVTAPDGCSWAATTPASWISFDSGAGGTGNGTVQYSVAVNSGTSERTASIDVGGQTHTVTQEACPGVTISPSTLERAALGGAYSQTLSASGGVAPYTYAVTGGSLPPGLSLSSDGVISGVPTSLGVYSFNVTATASYGCAGAADLMISVVTTDSATWVALNSGTTENLRAVHFLDASTGWVGGVPGALLRTSNGGADWTSTPFTSLGTDRINSVRLLSSNVGWAGSIRDLIRTVNGGSNWFTIEFSDSNMRAYSWYPISDSVIWGVGNVNGQSGYYHWRVTINPDASISTNFWWANVNRGMFGITFVDQNNGWSVGQQGTIVRISNASADSGSVSRQVQTSGTTADLNAVDAVDTQKAWAVGQNGVILRTTDGGTTWATLTSGRTENLRGVHFNDANTGWVVGDGGLVLATANGGDSWSQESTPVTSNLYGVSFAGAGYAVGNEGAILKRTTCQYAVSPGALSFGADGGNGAAVVTGTGGCSWVAVPQVAWIKVVSTSVVSGSGSVSFLVSPNHGAARTGTLTVAGSAVTIVQAAGTGVLMFPQYVNGVAGSVANRTRVVLQNNGSLSETGRVAFFDNAGNPVSVPIQGQNRQFLDCSLAPWGASDVQTDGTGALVIGALTVTSNQGGNSRVQGTEVFDLLGRYVSVASAPVRNTHQVYVSVNSSERTGMAAYNPGATPVTLTMTLVNDQGVSKATQQLTLLPGQQLARFVDEAELFQTYFAANPGDFKGTLNIRVNDNGEAPVTGLIQKSQTGALIAVATGPNVYNTSQSAMLAESPSPGVVLIFPHYVTGLVGSTPNRTRIVLKNNANQTDTGVVRFQDASGAPVVVTVGAQTGSDIPYSLPAWGTLDIETAGAGALKSGSVQVISDRGAASALEGTEVFDVLGAYVSVDRAPVRNSHRLYASRDTTEDTGIAVFNSSSEPIVLDLALIDDQGVQRATAELGLAAQQQVARFVDQAEMFKTYFDAHPGAFRGTLSVKVQDGKSVALVGLIQKSGSGALIAITPGTEE